MKTDLNSVLAELAVIHQHIAEPNWRLVKERVESLTDRLVQEKQDWAETYNQ